MMEKMEKESLTAQSSPENPAENTPEKPELNERVGIAEAILFVTGNAIEKREMCSAMNKVHKKAEPAPVKPKRICPFCKGEIADDATRCPHCTSMLDQ